VRNAWLTRIAAVFTALGMSGSFAAASPASMAFSSSRAKPAAPATLPTAAPRGNAHLPSSQISAVRHPFKYLAAAVSELPIGTSNHAGSLNPVMAPAPRHEDAISLNRPAGPPTPEFFISVAQLSERQGDVQQARQHLGQALSMWPGHVEILRAAARMEDRLNQMAMAETLYQQAVAANPGHPGALNDLGLCLARQGKLDASVQVLEQAIQLQPDKALYRNNAATVLVEMRDDQRALGHLAAVHGAAEANYNLGQLLVQRGRAAEATPYFQVAVDQNPQMQPAHVALAKLQGADVSRAAITAAQPVVTPATPAAQPGPSPQQPVPAGPQFHYPATARSPELGASTYAPPGYYPPSAGVPQTTDAAQPNTSPRYLPPVASQPRALQR
jgi:tetratricopeptide (TPR) repeat protein